MRIRLRLLLPVLALIPFVLISLQAYRDAAAATRGNSITSIYWLRVRLDSAPPKPHSEPVCEDANNACVTWDLEDVGLWAPPPPLLERAFVLAILPAFVIAVAITFGLGALGVSEIATFMIATPLLIVAWFYLIGFLIDRKKSKSIVRASPKLPQTPSPL